MPTPSWEDDSKAWATCRIGGDLLPGTCEVSGSVALDIDVKKSKGKDGAVLQETVETARGSEQNFAPDEEVVAKFRRLASKALPQSQIDDLADRVMHLEELRDASELARLLSVGSAR